MAAGLHYLGGLTPDDIVYCPLPLYHTAGGVISVGQAVLFGCTVAVKTKFSASQYFPDCIKFKATVCMILIKLYFNVSLPLLFMCVVDP